MQVFCERFLRFLAGEDPDSIVCDCSRGGPSVPDEVRDPNATVGIPEESEHRIAANLKVEFDHTVQMVYLVLWKAAR